MEKPGHQKNAIFEKCGVSDLTLFNNNILFQTAYSNVNPNLDLLSLLYLQWNQHTKAYYLAQ